MVVPSKEELEQAIESFVKESKTADLSKAKQYLEKQNPAWQIPDRRLRKFLKNQTARSESAVVDLASKKPRFGLKMFGAKSKTEVKVEAPPAQATAPPPEEEDYAPSPIQEEKPPAAAKVEVPVADAEVNAETTADTKEVTVTQMDDIDGDDEKPCFACASCVVM